MEEGKGVSLRQHKRKRKGRNRLGNAAERGAHINSATLRNVVGCSHGLRGVSTSTRRSVCARSSGFGRASAAAEAGGTSEAPLVAEATFSFSRDGSHDGKEGVPPGRAASAGSGASARSAVTTMAQASRWRRMACASRERAQRNNDLSWLYTSEKKK